MQRREMFLIVLIGMNGIFPGLAYAYLDPGAGSMFLQLLLGGAAGLALLIKLYWRRLLLLFGVDQAGDQKSEAGDQKGEDAQATEQK